MDRGRDDALVARALDVPRAAGVLRALGRQLDRLYFDDDLEPVPRERVRRPRARVERRRRDEGPGHARHAVRRGPARLHISAVAVVERGVVLAVELLRLLLGVQVEHVRLEVALARVVVVVERVGAARAERGEHGLEQRHAAREQALERAIERRVPPRVQVIDV